jgi:hypothetical protein
MAGMSGCSGGLYPVTGRVTFDDGSPLDDGAVICEQVDGEQPVTARGKINPDGTYRLGTNKPGDGARPGKYRVLVVPRSLTEREMETRPPIIDPRFEKFETSGLELEVKAGTNELNILVTKPKNWRRPAPTQN